MLDLLISGSLAEDKETAANNSIGDFADKRPPPAACAPQDRLCSRKTWAILLPRITEPFSEYDEGNEPADVRIRR
jgi:hypothetical protein